MSRPKQVFDTTSAYRFSAGLKGDLSSSWTWQTSVNSSASRVQDRATQLLFRPNLAPAVAGAYAAGGHARAGYLTGPGGVPFGSTGLIVNCPIVFRFL